MCKLIFVQLFQDKFSISALTVQQRNVDATDSAVFSLINATKLFNQDSAWIIMLFNTQRQSISI